LTGCTRKSRYHPGDHDKRNRLDLTMRRGGGRLLWIILGLHCQALRANSTMQSCEHLGNNQGQILRPLHSVFSFRSYHRHTARVRKDDTGCEDFRKLFGMSLQKTEDCVMCVLDCYHMSHTFPPKVSRFTFSNLQNVFKIYFSKYYAYSSSLRINISYLLMRMMIPLQVPKQIVNHVSTTHHSRLLAP
jgi:hypothetical protein